MSISNGKNALVTGAGRGIGRSVALCLAKAGYNVGVHYNASAEGALSLCEEIRAEGVEAIAIQANLADVTELGAMFDAFFAKFGTIDVMVNNSGITQFMSILEATPEHFDLLTNVDWRATYFCTQRAARNMVEHGTHGVIINTSSVHKEEIMGFDSVYSCAKAAISKFTRNAALELAPYKIRVNCISPGWIKTAKTPPTDREREVTSRLPWGRVGAPEEIGRTVLFLVDDGSEYITGMDITVDGGLTLPAMLDNQRYPLPAPSAANLPTKK